MPLVTVPTASGDAVRIRCELHTPWTQLLRQPGSQGSDAAQDQASIGQFSGSGSGSGSAALPAAAAATPSPAAAAAAAVPASPDGNGSSSSSFPADTTNRSQAAPGDGSTGEQQRHQHDQQQHRRQQGDGRSTDPIVNDPRRQKLLIIASLGVEGGSGWFSHVAEHFAMLRDPQTGEPAADVVTFDNRRRWSAEPRRQPPKEGASGYSSEAMAGDALRLMDALGWQQAHLVGMSLGAMVAAKAAAAAPQRVASLMLLGYTLNGWQMAASLVTRPHRLLPVIVGSERSRVRATLPFYFTRRFLDSPLSERQQAAVAATSGAAQPASGRWRGGGGSSRGAAARDLEASTGGQHGGDASTCSSDGGDVSVAGRHSRRLRQALLGRRQRQEGAEAPALATRQDAILANQALASDAARSGGSDSDGSTAAAQQGSGNGGAAVAGSSGGAAGVSGTSRAQLARPSRASPQARGFAQAADAALAEAGPAGPAPAGAAAGAADIDEVALPDTGLRSHSLACLLHWLTRAQARTIADAAFPTTLLVGRHDPVAPVKWVQAAAAWLRGTLIVTEASHAGLTVESCGEVLSTLELNVFGRTLGDRGAWTAVQDAAIDDAVTNPHLIKR